MFLTDPEKLPAQLVELMEADQVPEWKILETIIQRKYCPPVNKLEELIQKHQDVLDSVISNWDYLFKHQSESA